MNFEEIKNEILKEMEEFVYSEKELAEQAALSFMYKDDEGNISCEDDTQFVLKEEAYAYGSRQGNYTIDDYYALPDDVRVELIDGYFFKMNAPNLMHQEIVGEMYMQIASFIRKNDGKCKAFGAPVDTQLDCDNKTMVQPDITIFCDRNKNKGTHIYGASDFVMEIISKSTRRKDYTLKKNKYKNAGVREYWILDPYKRVLVIYNFENHETPVLCGLSEPMPMGIYNGKLMIDFSIINEIIDEYKDYLK